MRLKGHGSFRQRNGVRNYINKIAAAAAGLLFVTVAHAAATIYPEIGRASADIDAGMKEAAKTQRRVIVDFGGNWCADCIVLDKLFHAPENAALLEKHYVLVHVNVGDKGISDNFPIAERYGVPLKKGVPALVVLEPDGKLVYSQKQGEFEAMRKMDPSSVGDFLKKWAGS
jgi:thiol:disulfide interchange protein